MQTHRSLILGTAGHIDHGKTALVRALTGVDTDRLPEEKKRGITIDIGFAHLELGEYTFGIVDVPGHERFIRNMLAGAAGIDVALLVIAADDSVMPQTREHLAILNLLDIPAGVIAMTKCDASDEGWTSLVEDEIRELVTDTFLADAPIVRTSARTGEGLDQLRAALSNVAAHIESQRGRESQNPFRLPIDRSFVLEGLGTIVTGTVTSGSVAAGDEVAWLPHDRPVRIRGLQAHGQSVDTVTNGQRAAVQLAGVHHQEVQRGHELASFGYLRPTRRLAAMVRMLSEQGRAFRHRTRVRVHIGTKETMATVVLLDRQQVQPGESCTAVLICADPVTATGGQAFVIRSESPVMTIGGGHVLFTNARNISRRHRERTTLANRMLDASPAVRIETAMLLSGRSPLTRGDLIRESRSDSSQTDAVLRSLTDSGKAVASPFGWLHVDTVLDLETRVMKAMESLHAEAAPERTVPLSRLTRHLNSTDDAMIGLAVNRLVSKAAMVSNEAGVALRSHATMLSDEHVELRERVLSEFIDAGFRPPALDELAASTGATRSDLDMITRYCREEGTLVHLGGGMFLHQDTHDDLMRRMRVFFDENDTITVSELRELLGTSRKYAVPICEHLDRIGATKRRGDERVLGTALRALPSSP